MSSRLNQNELFQKSRIVSLLSLLNPEIIWLTEQSVVIDQLPDAAVHKLPHVHKIAQAGGK
jgi:hypothetical protein